MSKSPSLEKIPKKEIRRKSSSEKCPTSETLHASQIANKTIITSTYQSHFIAHDHLKQVSQKYFVAQPVEVNPFKLMLGAVFSAEVATTDHPGKPATATFERISDYLLKYDQGAEALTVKP